MSKKEILGYSIYFKDKETAKDFYKKIPKSFDSKFNKKENEVMILGTEQMKKDDFCYVFSNGDENVSIEPLKVKFVETLFVRE